MRIASLRHCVVFHPRVMSHPHAHASGVDKDRQQTTHALCYTAEIWAVDMQAATMWKLCSTRHRGRQRGEGEEEMRTSSLCLTLSHLLFLLILSACEQDEVCETESCGENELSDVSSYT